MKRILIIGATSAIALAAARRWLELDRDTRFVLAARNAQKLDAVAADLRVRGASALDCRGFDAGDFAALPVLVDAAWAALGEVDCVLIAHGSLPDQKDCERSVERTLAEFSTNALSVIALLTALANRMQAQGHGTIAVIGSVAGDRGRQSNYVYGAAKGALDVFLQGLRNRLFHHGVHVITLKPGFVDTPMTAAFAKGPLWSSPARVAARLVSACERRRDVAYLPGFWWLIMCVIRAIPEALFKRMSL